MNRYLAMTTFVAIVETENLTMASKKLDIAPSVINEVLDELESYLGTKLLTFHGGGIRLTIVGRKYFLFCRSILIEIARAEQSVRKISVSSLRPQEAADLQ